MSHGKTTGFVFFFFSSRRRHTRLQGDWSSDVCSSDLDLAQVGVREIGERRKLAKRELRELALRADELAERLYLRLPGILSHVRLAVQDALVAGAWFFFASTGVAAATRLSAKSRCALSSCSANPKLVFTICSGVGSSSANGTTGVSGIAFSTALAQVRTTSMTACWLSRIALSVCSCAACV